MSILVWCCVVVGFVLVVGLSDLILCFVLLRCVVVVCLRVLVFGLVVWVFVLFGFCVGLVVWGWFGLIECLFDCCLVDFVVVYVCGFVCCFGLGVCYGLCFDLLCFVWGRLVIG